jgi:hypothetical protein
MERHVDSERHPPGLHHILVTSLELRSIIIYANSGKQALYYIKIRRSKKVDDAQAETEKRNA